MKKLAVSNSAVLLLGWLGTLATGCDPVEHPLAGTNALGPAPMGAAGAATGSQVVAMEPSPAEPNAEDPMANIDDLATDDGSLSSTNRESDAGVGGDAGVNCPGCFILGNCVAQDAVDPENPCQICDVARDPQGWSNNDGVSCDDGLFCTVDDVCQDRACQGSPRNCEDGVACNGVSTCLEDSDRCSAPISQCGNNAVCDATTDTCQSTCDGCVINGVCVTSGMEAQGNPCQVCDPSRSTTAYSIVAGKACGAAATACSGQDTCDAQGRCQPNNLPANTPCGSPNSSACDQPDACDGNGTCQQRLAANGSTCDDGAFCTVGDQCQGGRCVSGGNRNCGDNQTCNEGANRCQCQGRRDCTSPLDNDCDGRPDNTIDNVCTCTIGQSRSCQTHPQDGVGQCRAGTQQCVAGQGNSSATFGNCTGSVGPAAADSCSTPGNDANCDGVRNGGCACIAGQGNGPCSGDANNARCNGQGQCVPCQTDADCSLVSGGRNSCEAGSCVESLLGTGESCTSGTECSSGSCQDWFTDLDGDGFGTGVAQRRCGAPTTGFAGTPGDCCDVAGAGRTVAATIFPGQTRFFETGQTVCNRDPFDYDCNGSLSDQFGISAVAGSNGNCDANCGGQGWVQPPNCGVSGTIVNCERLAGFCSINSDSPTARNVVRQCH